MQGLADGYFVIPYTIANYFASNQFEKLDDSHPACQEAMTVVKERMSKLLSVNGTRTVDSFHRELGKIMWENCGMARNRQGLEKALQLIPELREQYWKDVRVLGTNEEFNQSLEKAGRVGDFLELAELMCLDALEREESCGAHFREEYQTPDHEAGRNDDDFTHVAVWEYKGDGVKPVRHKEELEFENVHLQTRSYK
jgi:succinate dehydrogenase / fumarate reductase flavoprotein subunit